MTLDEFLAWESAQKEKHMFWDGEVYAMGGGSPAHAELAPAITAALWQQVKRPCRLYGSELAVEIPGGNYVYPDSSLACGPQFTEGPVEQLTNPLVIFEVLSDTTEAFDRGEKFYGYARLPSLRHYVLVSQHEKRVDVFSRDSARGKWVLTQLASGGEFTLAPPGVVLNVDALYGDIPLTPAPKSPLGPKRRKARNS